MNKNTTVTLKENFNHNVTDRDLLKSYNFKKGTPCEVLEIQAKVKIKHPTKDVFMEVMIPLELIE